MYGGLLAPEQETFPNRYRWTVAECYRLKALGFLEGRFEVIDGEVVNKMGQSPPHFFAIGQLAHWAGSVFGDGFVRVQGPVSLPGPDGAYSEPEPDVAITREPLAAYANRHPGPEDIVLVMEVSDTTLRTDLLVKARLYARAEIPEYWVLDLNSRSLHCHREPASGDYALIEAYDEGDTISPAARSDAAVTVSSLLPPIEDQNPRSPT